MAFSTTASPSFAPAGIRSFASSAQSIAHRCMRFCGSDMEKGRRKSKALGHEPMGHLPLLFMYVEVVFSASLHMHSSNCSHFVRSAEGTTD